MNTNRTMIAIIMMALVTFASPVWAAQIANFPAAANVPDYDDYSKNTVVGPKGDKGDQGEPGPKGDKGDPGTMPEGWTPAPSQMQNKQWAKEAAAEYFAAKSRGDQAAMTSALNKLEGHLDRKINKVDRRVDKVVRHQTHQDRLLAILLAESGRDLNGKLIKEDSDSSGSAAANNNENSTATDNGSDGATTPPEQKQPDAAPPKVVPPVETTTTPANPWTNIWFWIWSLVAVIFFLAGLMIYRQWNNIYCKVIGAVFMLAGTSFLAYQVALNFHLSF